MNKCFILFAIFSLISCNSELEPIIFKQFQKFIKDYKKDYSSLNEYLSRYQVFRENFMLNINSKKSSFKTGITQFSDLTKKEFSQIYLNLNYNSIKTNFKDLSNSKKVKAAPPSFDWRDNGVVGPVPNQGICTASWAFTTMSNLEGLYAIHEGTFKKFSAQMLIDCDTNNSGCNGGLMEYSFNWLKKNGIMLESDYPYTGKKQVCKSDKTKYINMKVTGYKKLGSSTSTWSAVDEEEMKEFLYLNGPLTIALNGNALQKYTEGIIDASESECPSSGINHAVLVVGYGVDSVSGLDYWIIQNVWGESWGESGYFRIRRGNGTCGVNYYVITGVVSFD